MYDDQTAEHRIHDRMEGSGGEGCNCNRYEGGADDSATRHIWKISDELDSNPLFLRLHAVQKSSGNFHARQRV